MRTILYKSTPNPPRAETTRPYAPSTTVGTRLYQRASTGWTNSSSRCVSYRILSHSIIDFSYVPLTLTIFHLREYLYMLPLPDIVKLLSSSGVPQWNYSSGSYYFILVSFDIFVHWVFLWVLITWVTFNHVIVDKKQKKIAHCFLVNFSCAAYEDSFFIQNFLILPIFYEGSTLINIGFLIK